MSNIAQITEPPKPITFFPDVLGSNKEEREMTLLELGASCRETSASTKAELPLVSLARFGNAKSDRGSYRHNQNALSISGIIGDYDGGQMSIDEAKARLIKARVRALLYTTARHSSEKPRWRIIAPLSAELPPSDHSRLTSRLNGVVDGVLAQESFTVSQAYYFGFVEGGQNQRLELIDGDFMDLRNDLDAGAIGRGSTVYHSKSSPRNASETYDVSWLESLSEQIKSHNLNYADWIKSGFAWKRAGLSFESWANFSRKHETHHSDSDECLLAKWESFNE